MLSGHKCRYGVTSALTCVSLREPEGFAQSELRGIDCFAALATTISSAGIWAGLNEEQ